MGKKTIKLYKHQQDLLDKNPTRLGIWWHTGTGKSLALISLAEKNVSSALLVCPKSIKQKWIDDVAGSDTTFTILTKEEFRRDHKKIPKHDAFIIDEVHHFSSPKSQLHKSALAWCKKNTPEHVWLATATPYRSTPWNVYAMYALLGQPLKWNEFRARFFNEQYMGHKSIPVPDETKTPELQQLLRDVGSLVTLEECVDMPDAVFSYETIPLTPQQLHAIDALEEINPIVRYSKIHQMENGTLKGNEYEEDQVFSCNKIDRILEIAESTRKIAIFAKYNLQVKTIAEAFIESDKQVFIFTGETKNDAEVIAQAEQAEDAVIIINSEKAEGYELPSFKRVVYASLPWSLVSWTQSLGRFRRINRPQRVYYTILTADGEVDKAVQRSLEKKKDFQLELFIKKK